MTRDRHHRTRSSTVKMRRILAVAFLVVVPAYLAGAGRGSENNKESKKQQKIEALFPEAAAEAEANTPPAGYASLYVLRPSGILGMAGGFYLSIDHEIWGCLNNGQFSWDPLSPGQHTFSRTSLRTSTVQIAAEPGKTYYAVLTPNTAKVISAEEGEKLRRRLSLNPQRWLYRQYLSNWPAVHIGMKAHDVAQLIRISDGQVYEEGPQGGGLFKGQGMIGDAPITWSPDSSEVNFHSPVLGQVYRLSKNQNGQPVSVIQFTSAAVGYRLTFTNGVLTEKLDAGQLHDIWACWATWH